MQLEKIIEKYIDDSHAIFVCDCNGLVVYSSARAKQFLQTLSFSAPQQLLPEDHQAFTRKVFSNSKASHPLVIDEVKRNDTYIEYVYTSKYGYVVVECFDVTQARKREMDLMQQALYDQVTGIPNRMFFLEEIEKEIIKSETDNTYFFGMTFLDLNDFKQMNDTHGHAFGDVYLRTFAQELVSATGLEHGVFRYAGDEFIIIMRNIRSYEKISLVLKRIGYIGSQAYSVLNTSVTFAASIGSVLYQKGMTSKEMLDAADKAMYESKKRKKTEPFPYTFAA